MKWALIPVFLAASLLGSSGMPNSAVCQNAPVARSARQRDDERKAMVAFAGGDYQNALQLLLQLYADYRGVEYLRDIARCYVHLKNPTRAAATLAEYLAQAKHLSPKEKASIEAEIKDIGAAQSRPEASAQRPSPPGPGKPTTASVPPTAAVPAGEAAATAATPAASTAPTNPSATQPTPPATHEENGERLLSAGHFAEAAAELDQAYRATRNPGLLHDMALCHLRLGNTKQALELYEDYVVRVPNSPRRPAIEARIRELRQGVAANSPVTEGSTNVPPSSSASDPPAPGTETHEQKGKRLFQSGRYAEAAVELEIAYQASRDHALVYDLAVCHDRLHHTKQALELYEDFLVDAPKSSERALIETRIQELRQDLARAAPPPSPSHSAAAAAPPVPTAEPAPQPVALPPLPSPAPATVPGPISPPGLPTSESVPVTSFAGSVPEMPPMHTAPEAVPSAVQPAVSAGLPAPSSFPEQTAAPATPTAGPSVPVSSLGASPPSAPAKERTGWRLTDVSINAQFLLSPAGRWHSSFCQAGVCGQYQGNMAGTIGAAIGAEHRVLKYLAYGLDLSYLREKPKAAQSYSDDLQVGPSVRLVAAFASIEIYTRFALGLRLSFLPRDLTRLDNGAELDSTGTGWFLRVSGGLIARTAHAGVFLEPGYFYGTAATSGSGRSLDISTQYFLLTTGVIVFL